MTAPLPERNEKAPSYGTAINALRPGCEWIIYENDLTKFEWSDINTLPRPTDAEIIAERDRQQAVWDAKQYQRDRAPRYPNLESQLDMLYHDIKTGNLDSGTWVEAIERIKTAYPKPE
tara:strand:- start:99 stop:452 length:354 start_codon:yes stop_codon:yes gene_type:complete